MTKEHSVTYAQEKGPRNYQEDNFFYQRIENPQFHGWLLAVMDGHNGASVAELCAKEIKNLFTLQDADHTENALQYIVSVLNERTKHSQAGSTLSIALVLEDHNKVSIAILGDSPIVVLDGKEQLHISPEHNVRSNLKECESAEKRGGICAGGYLYT